MLGRRLLLVVLLMALRGEARAAVVGPLASPMQDADVPIVLTDDQSCLDCHQDLLQREVVHEPVDSETCEACHRQPDAEAHEFRPIQNVSKRCLMCHDAFEGETVHDPVAEGDCMVCHRPHSSNREFLLKGASDGQLCGMCHEDQRGEDMAFVHEPVAEDGCTLCHTPHASDRKRLLKRAGRKLCLACHGDIKELITDSEVVHGAVQRDDECLNCHVPHHSEIPSLLAQPVKETCLECHERSLKREDGTRLVAIGRKLTAEFVHAPVADGECTACHAPHGGPRAALLQGNFPATFYTPYKARSYRLCFVCHDQEVFETAETDDLTEFRQGTRNLHFLHVNKDPKGRSCRACHDPHGSGQPAQIADVVRFGDWAFPLRFERTDEGGTCTTACHEERTYRR